MAANAQKKTARHGPKMRKSVFRFAGGGVALIVTPTLRPGLLNALSSARTSLGSPPRCSHGIPDESFEMQDWKPSKSFVLGSWQTIVLPILPFSPHATDACHFLASLWSKWRMFRGNHAGELEVSTNTNVWYFYNGSLDMFVSTCGLHGMNTYYCNCMIYYICLLLWFKLIVKNMYLCLLNLLNVKLNVRKKIIYQSRRCLTVDEWKRILPLSLATSDYMFLKLSNVHKTLTWHEPRNPNWLIGILELVHSNPHVSGFYNPLYSTNNQGFGHCWLVQLPGSFTKMAYEIIPIPDDPWDWFICLHERWKMATWTKGNVSKYIPYMDPMAYGIYIPMDPSTS